MVTQKMHEIKPMNARTETDHNGVLKQCMVYNQRIKKQNLNRMETEKNACFKTTECKKRCIHVTEAEQLHDII